MTWYKNAASVSRIGKRCERAYGVNEINLLGLLTQINELSLVCVINGIDYSRAVGYDLKRGLYE